jgi:hypothetical protein
MIYLSFYQLRTHIYEQLINAKKLFYVTIKRKSCFQYLWDKLFEVKPKVHQTFPITPSLPSMLTYVTIIYSSASSIGKHGDLATPVIKFLLFGKDGKDR